MIFPTGLGQDLRCGQVHGQKRWSHGKEKSQINTPDSALRGNLSRLIQEEASRAGNWDLILQSHSLNPQAVQGFASWLFGTVFVPGCG